MAASPAPRPVAPADQLGATLDEATLRFAPDLSPTIRVEPCPFAAGRVIDALAIQAGIEIGLSADDALVGGRS